MSEAARILERMKNGDPSTPSELLPVVYEELRKLAVLHMSREAPGNTLQPTALVHEAWLRLVGEDHAQFENHGHFFAAAAEAMRRILIDRARQRRALKRGGNLERVDFDGVEVALPDDDETLLAVSDAVEKLARQDPEAAQLIRLRFYAGLTNEEAALVLGVPERTARRHWSFAKAWLYREMQRQAKA
ncbi:MAG: sigma-70 family RNA polymerase sigma factor [Verrucomicrobiales bacterium]|nr:sigma-70 family RNA polymerase sigma factor [Verrucomicrobiales bacterium]